MNVASTVSLLVKNFRAYFRPTSNKSATVANSTAFVSSNDISVGQSARNLIIGLL